MSSAKLIAGGVAGAGLLALLTCSFGSNANIHSASEGEAFLAGQGYKDITGGEASSGYRCIPKAFARDYDVVNKDNTHETKTVCFGAYGNYSP